MFPLFTITTFEEQPHPVEKKRDEMNIKVFFSSKENLCNKKKMIKA